MFNKLSKTTGKFLVATAVLATAVPFAPAPEASAATSYHTCYGVSCVIIGEKLRTDANTYYAGSTSVDVTFTIASSTTYYWNMFLEKKDSNGNYSRYTAAGTKTGYTNINSPSYRSFAFSTLTSGQYQVVVEITSPVRSTDYLYVTPFTVSK